MARSERVLRSSSSSRSASRSSDSAALTPGIKASGVRRLGLGLEPSHLLGGCRGLPALELGTRSGGGLQSLPLGLLHECAPGATSPSRRRPLCASGRNYESGRIFLGTRHRPREEESTDEHGDQYDTGFRDDAARGAHLPAAETHCFQRLIGALPCGVNRQLARLSPICSHPSPSTWRATYSPSSVRS